MSLAFSYDTMSVVRRCEVTVTCQAVVLRRCRCDLGVGACVPAGLYVLSVSFPGSPAAGCSWACRVSSAAYTPAVLIYI